MTSIIIYNNRHHFTSFYHLFNSLIHFIIPILLIFNFIPNGCLALKCLDCVGRDCMGSTCTGDYCMISRYAPRWGTMVWGEPVIVKGCLSGRMIRGDMRSHCEVIGDGKDEDEPITGAMHRTIAKIPDDLLYTESCACEGNNCNAKKPKIRVPERSRCEAMVEVNVMGHNMTSKNNAKCTGEFCFKVEIRSKIGHMKNYRTMGCASFDDKSQLPEELQPTGCASFASENLDVEACFKTFDKEAIARHKARSKGKKKTKSRPRSSEEKISEEEEEEENEDSMKEDDWDKEEEEEKEGKENEGKEEAKEEKAQHYIIEKPTFGPELNESTNSTLISVFILLILLILLSGVVWKFQLHKRLFRASYDSVAGGT
uniref:Activin_recp domain-containing protein n=1 Tax=Meloidogyne hapla TaxID=6305 RepID=A0A1I8BR21_MELHA